MDGTKGVVVQFGLLSEVIAVLVDLFVLGMIPWDVFRIKPTSMLGAFSSQYQQSTSLFRSRLTKAHKH